MDDFRLLHCIVPAYNNRWCDNKAVDSIGRFVLLAADSLVHCADHSLRYNKWVSRRFGAGLYPNYERDIYLQVKVTGGGICYFSYSLDGRKYTLAGVPFTARQGKWIGAKVGLFSTAPYA